MPAKRGKPNATGADDLIHAWIMDRAFSLSAWLDLCAAASGLKVAYQHLNKNFSLALHESLCRAPASFSVTCTENSITLRASKAFGHGGLSATVAGEDLVIHRYPRHARRSVNSAGRPHEPVIRALLAMAVHFGNGFRITTTGADQQDWHETECLVSMLLGVDVSGIHPDAFPPPHRKITGPSGPEGAWAVSSRHHGPRSQTLAAA